MQAFANNHKSMKRFSLTFLGRFRRKERHLQCLYFLQSLRLEIRQTVTLISVFMSIFCGRKWRRGDSRPWRPRTIPSLWPFFFHLFGASRLIDVGQVALTKSFLSLKRSWALRLDHESGNKMTSLPENNVEKFMESKTGFRRSKDRS